MSKQMLIDATHAEETRVVVLEDGRLDEFDVDTSTKKQLKSNIYLAKVVRVEPSLQAAFVDYGGNKHGFLAFGEIHPDYYQLPVADREALKEQMKAEALEATRDAEENSEESGEIENVSNADTEDAVRHRSSFFRKYKIQEVIRQGQVMLVQVIKEERGNKGAALTTYLSLAGRFSVLMPNNSRGGGVSRKINNAKDRKALRDIVEKLPIPDGMSVIIRTAGQGKTKSEIKRDFDYLMKTWMQIRKTTLESIAPKLIHEEGDIIKRSLRDILTADTDEILVEGENVFKSVRAFMKTLLPSQVKKVKQYKGKLPLFQEYQVESQLEAVHSNIVQLRSGGYLVIDQTEALVAVDVNSGRATREHNIEETALRTNLETCDELARQLRLRDLAGLIVIDFIDMDEPRNNAAVERRLKEALKNERARIQVGKMSGFGLLEMSRQRLRSSVLESSYHVCPHCGGKGLVRSTESAAMHALHILDEAASKNQSNTLIMTLPPDITNYILNMKRNTLQELENRFNVSIQIMPDDNLLNASDYRIERLRADGVRLAIRLEPTVSRKVDRNSERMKSIDEIVKAAVAESESDKEKNHHGRRRRHDWKRKQKQLAENQAQLNEEHASEEPKNEGEVNFTIVEQATLAETEPTQETVSHKKGRYRDRKKRQDKKGAVKKEETTSLPVVHENHVPAKREDQPLPAPVEATDKPKRGGWWNRLVG